MLAVPESLSVAPNLIRVAVISAPVRGLDEENINEMLNAGLLKALEWTVQNAATNGWKPDILMKGTQHGTPEYKEAMKFFKGAE